MNDKEKVVLVAGLGTITAAVGAADAAQAQAVDLFSRDRGVAVKDRPHPEYEALGVGRISYGPMTQRVALTALQDVASSLYAESAIPPSTRALN